MYKLLMKLQRDERGVSALEYAILAGVIVVIVAAAVVGFGDQITTLFNNADAALESAVNAGGGTGESGTP